MSSNAGRWSLYATNTRTPSVISVSIAVIYLSVTFAKPAASVEWRSRQSSLHNTRRIAFLSLLVYHIFTSSSSSLSLSLFLDRSNNST